MTQEQAQHLTSAFWKGFTAGLSTRPIVSPPADYLTSLDATWAAQDVANNPRATVEGIPFVKLGDWLLSANGMSLLTLAIQFGSDSYELTFAGATTQPGLNLSLWTLGDLQGYLVSAQYAMMGLPEPGTYLIDLWSDDTLADAIVTAKLEDGNVKITNTSITWTGLSDGLETASVPFGDSTLTYVKVSYTVPSTNLSDYTGVTVVSDGSVQELDISDEGDYAAYKTITDDSYITLVLLYAMIVYVDSIEMDGTVLTKGVWFVKVDDTTYTKQIEGNFSNV